MSGSTAATLVLTEDWDVMVAAQLLGHTSVTTTSKYLDEQPGELRWRSTPPPDSGGSVGVRCTIAVGRALPPRAPWALAHEINPRIAIRV